MTFDSEDPLHDVFIRIAPVSRREGARAVRVFISSTFRDMNGERDVLVKEVLPELRKRCAEIDVEFSFVDLRWGITDEQVEQGEVLSVCLGEIERCRPFFVGLLGEYYGSQAREIPQDLSIVYPWLGEPRVRSVTEVEACAILNHPAIPWHAAFYFRDVAYLASLPESTRDEWTSRGQDASKLRELKDRIRASGLPHRMYADPKALRDLVLNDLWTAIAAEFPPGDNDVQREDARHQIFLGQHTRLYVGKQSTVRRLDEHCTGFGPPLVVRGPSGAGKSALVANWLEERSRKGTGQPIFVHSVGSTPTSSRWESLLIRFMSWASSVLGIQGKIPEEREPEDLLIAFQRFLHAAEKSQPLLLLDGVSELLGPDGFAPLCWLPEEIPDGVHIILTARDESDTLTETRRRGWPDLQIGPLTEQERKELIRAALERVGRRLPEDDLMQIVTADVTRLPLYTRILIQELCTIGRYEELSDQIRLYLEAESLDSLYAKLFRRWEQDYGADVVQRTLVLTAVARDGLMEQDLLTMTVPGEGPLTSSRLSPFLYSAELEISPRPGIFALTNPHVARAIEHTYLTPERIGQAREALISYFQKPTQTAFGFAIQIRDQALRKKVARVVADAEGKLNALQARAFNELPWQLYNAQRWEELSELVGQRRYLKWAQKERPRDAARWWRELSAQGHRAATAFAEELSSDGDAEPDVLESVAVLLTEIGEDQEAYHARELLVARYQAANAWRPLGWARMKQAQTLVSQEEFNLACEYYHEAESSFLKADDVVGAACAKAELGIALFKRGVARWRIKDISESSRVLQGSLRVLQQEGMTTLLGTVYNALGVALGMQGDLESARDYLKRAQYLFRSMGQRAQVAEVFQNRGILETAAGQRDAAADAFRTAVQLYRELGDDVRASQVEGALADVTRRRSFFRQGFLQKLFKR